MESPTRKDESEDRDRKMTGFATAVGNGIFWVLPFVMYFVPITLVGFSLYDNGNLTDSLRRYGIIMQLSVIHQVTYQQLFTSLLSRSFTHTLSLQVSVLTSFASLVVSTELVSLCTAADNNITCGCRWLFWSFFCAFFVVGGYFNLLIHFINNHRWRFSGECL